MFISIKAATLCKISFFIGSTMKSTESITTSFHGGSHGTNLRIGTGSMEETFVGKVYISKITTLLFHIFLFYLKIVYLILKRAVHGSGVL